MAYILSKAPILCRSVFHKNIISGPVNKNALVRSYEHLANKTNPWAEQKYKQKDNISDGYRLVYREHSTMNGFVAAAYHIGWLGFGFSIFCMGYLIYMKPPVQEKGTKGVFLSEDTLKPLTNVGRVVLLLLSFTVSIVLIVGSKTIPFRIYYNSAEKVYKAVFVSRILGKKQIETFGAGTVVPVFSRKRVGDILFNINGRIVILDKECFPVQSVREQMLCKIK